MDAEILAAERIAERLEGALERSPADETSIAWLEYRQQRSSNRRSRPTRPPAVVRSILVRVLESGRVGTFRTSSWGEADLDRAVRQAMASARGATRIPGFPHLPTDRSPLPECGPLHDPEVAELNPATAQQLLRGLTARGQSAHLSWTEMQLAVFAGRHVRRHATATSVALEVRHRKAPGAGFAAAASRTLAGLHCDEVAARAAGRHASGGLGALPETPLPTVLAPEATAQLVDLVNRMALTAQAYQGGRSFLREHLGVQVFDRGFELVDDSTKPFGLPFPFDYEGTAKRRVALVEQGTPRTPALDQLHAGILGLAPTPHACAGDDARADNLFVQGGDLSGDETLSAADGGIWISHFDRMECFDPRRIQMRAVARGVRRIREGRLTEVLPDLAWEASVLQVFGVLGGVGKETVTTAHQTGTGSAVTAPAVVVADGVGFSPLIRAE